MERISSHILEKKSTSQRSEKKRGKRNFPIGKIPGNKKIR
jgi:hypothetical protein